MNWLEFWASIVKTIAWPIIVLVAILIFRKPIETLIAQLKLKRLKYKDFDAAFEDDLKNAESKVNTSDIAKDTESSGNNHDIEERFFTQITEEAPYLGVFMSWHELEIELVKAMRRLGNPVQERPMNFLNRSKLHFDYLLENGYITQNYFDLFLDLRRMRNKAVHHPESVITYEDSIRYRKITKKVIRQLEDINPIEPDVLIHR
ncbi:hypothetical protein EH11_01743 [Bacillus subtilis]|uniref:hypothetical protein n=1 Tax=Bacillus TaxID=1386 RepID=UPI000C332C2F|nr:MULTISPECIES: hypothetical protein [Bacillus]PKJ57768.1 hypothetical protein CW370_20140 [Bacillus sp. SN32]RPK02413.1 hypothetical protein EH11_01743 [Bacillus subtilis]RUS08620.1 hypothetical protein EFW59_01748 [Bacillus subtilis]